MVQLIFGKFNSICRYTLASFNMKVKRFIVFAIIQLATFVRLLMHGQSPPESRISNAVYVTTFCNYYSDILMLEV